MLFLDYVGNLEAQGGTNINSALVKEFTKYYDFKHF